MSISIIHSFHKHKQVLMPMFDIMFDHLSNLKQLKIKNEVGFILVN
jgi:hypothetical protein